MYKTCILVTTDKVKTRLQEATSGQALSAHLLFSVYICLYVCTCIFASI